MGCKRPGKQEAEDGEQEKLAMAPARCSDKTLDDLSPAPKRGKGARASTSGVEGSAYVGAGGGE